LKKTSMVANSAAEAFGVALQPHLTLISPPAAANAYQRGALAKRTFDVTAAAIGMLLLAPLFLGLYLATRLSSRGPAIYTQRRVGAGGRRFAFYKFRTMVHRNDDSIHRAYSERLINGWAQRDGGRAFKLTTDPRVTPFGRFLRKSSLDELPQLFNVLRGDMSLVGPRPPIEYEVDYYQDWHKQRLQAKPGITGLWQVSGRSQVPFDEMVMLDIHYMEHWSFLLDLKILLRTFPVVVFGVGGY
jgi:lipopolysaccharide/colanic/teichoic acid biosynthesis glycosyltransferase